MSNPMYLNYPRILSLSTLNIKHHGNQDYLFHPTRTEFVGDSGYGKSMIGDMLQLIFVGSKEFRSGTDVDTGHQRKPQGMLLDHKESNNFGYIFLNIAIEAEKFIVIGMCIEQHSQPTIPFIIHSGFNEEILESFSSPMTHRDFSADGKILPIVELKNSIEQKSARERIVYIFKNRIGTYHSILKSNSILPIDLSTDEQKIKSYAQILQSFARGKGFKVDSHNLKRFLFGDDDAHRINSMLDRESTQMRSLIENYHRNKEQSNKISIIGDDLHNLQKLSNKVKESERDYYIAYAMVCYKKLLENSSQLAETKLSISILNYKLLLIEKRKYLLNLQNQEEELLRYSNNKDNIIKLYNEQRELQSEIDQLNRHKLDVEREYHRLRLDSEKINLVKQWLDNHGGTLNAISNFFATQIAYDTDKKRLQALIEVIQENNLWDQFQSSMWITNVDLAREKTKNIITEIEHELAILEVLKVFTDVTNPDSLAHWILDQSSPLSLEQESVLLHFQSLPRRAIQRTKYVRYLPHPNDFFSNIKVHDKKDDGFWIDLDGVYEFIELSSLNIRMMDKSELLDYLNKQQSDISQRYATCQSEKKSLVNLERLLTSHGYTQSDALLFNRKSDIEQFIVDETLQISNYQFNQYIELYQNADIILKKFNESEKQYNELIKLIEDHNKKYSYNEFTVNILKDNTKDIDENVINEKIKNNQKLIININKKIDEIGDNINKNEYHLFSIEIDNISLESIHNLEKYLIEQRVTMKMNIDRYEQDEVVIRKEYEQSQSDFVYHLGHAFNPAEYDAIADVAVAKFQLDEDNKLFEVERKVFIDKNGGNDYYRLQDNTDINEIAKIILPVVFENKSTENIHITQDIAKYLEDINEKNRQISLTSNDMIARIFSSVRKINEEYVQTIRRLNAFFKNKDTYITGEYQVNLRLSLSNQYPVAWLDEVTNSLSMMNKPMFAQDFSGTSLQDIIIDSFKRHTGTMHIPNLNNILDPKNYFDLQFELKNERGVTYGSEGQAYTAIALLCIARLSIVENARGKILKGIRFMPIDEAEGIGSNYQTLYNLALTYGYQVVSMSINPVQGVKAGGQTTYTLIPSPDTRSGVNSPPFYLLGYYHEYAELFFGGDNEDEFEMA